MSTNYYLHRTCPDPCEHCALDELHIGKNSVGWQFAWQAHESLGITSVRDWDELFRTPGNSIRSEYGVTYTVDDFYEVVNESRVCELKSEVGDYHYLDPLSGMIFTRVDFC